MEILFVSDYVCPYCLVAKEALHRALRKAGIQASITYQPYELTPEPKERVDTYHDPRRRASYQILVEPCRQMELDMKLPPKVIPRPYTRLAFEGWYYACDRGKGEEYNDLLYRAYFIRELDIGEVSVLAALAGEIGLDEADFTKALLDSRYTEKERQAVTYAREVLKPQGVPTIYMDGKKIGLSDYTEAEMLRILNDNAFTGPGHFCGPDGC